MHMTFKEIEVYKAAELKKIKWISIAALAVVALMVFRVSIILGMLLFVVILIPTIAVSYDAKSTYKGTFSRHKKAEKKYNWDNEPIMLFTHGVNVKPYKIVVLFAIYTVIYFGFISMLFDYLDFAVFLAIVLMSTVGIGIILKSAVAMSKYTILLTPSGICVNKIKYAYHEMKRHQFIKMKKGGYILEINTGEIYFKFFVNDQEKVLIEKNLSKASLAV